MELAYSYFLLTPAKCHDSPSNTFYGEAESWEPNDCTVCVCRNGTPECLATVCRHPDCKEPLYIKGQCCPVCPLIDPSSSDHNEAGEKPSTIFFIFRNWNFLKNIDTRNKYRFYDTFRYCLRVHHSFMYSLNMSTT